MDNVLPFRQTRTPKPLTRLDVSRRKLVEPFVLALMRRGWRIKVDKHRVWLVSP